jgi:hypothetical protein
MVPEKAMPTVLPVRSSPLREREKGGRVNTALEAVTVWHYLHALRGGGLKLLPNFIQLEKCVVYKTGAYMLCV